VNGLRNFQGLSEHSRIAIASGYVFICCFLAGPAFGLFAIRLALWPFNDASVSLETLALIYLFALILGGVQGYRAGLRLTDALDRSGYIPFNHVLTTTGRVAFTPSSLIALLYFIGAWAAHDLKGLFLWPILAFAISSAVHAFAALCVSALIFPLMRQPKHRLPAR